MPAQLTVTQPADFSAFPAAEVHQGIHQRIEKIAQLSPRQIAVESGPMRLEYRHFDGYANAIADAILSVCGRKLAQAAILLPTSTLTVLSMIGALKAQKAYVPLDLHFPKERLRAMIEDAAPAVVLTDPQHLELARELSPAGIPVLAFELASLAPDAPSPGLPCEPTERAYILYTSGSTGRPKGIEFVHRNLLHTTMCLTNQLFYSPSDRVTWLHSPTFGSSVVDIYCCLTNGGTLLPWDVKAQGFTGMADWLVRERATTFQWIPSAFRQFVRTLEPAQIFDSIRIAVMAGEPLTIREVEMFRRHFARGSHLVNQLGTAESYNYYLYRVDHDIELEGAAVPGGYPVSPEREVLILDETRQPLPAGQVGEIAIRSDYMAAGYWNNAEQTEAKFVRIGADSRPVYLTGDVGRIEPDGCLTHLGRGDFQIKLRGCRVEVAEIEHVLGALPGVEDSAAWIAKNRVGEDQLIGYVVMAAGAQFDEPQAISRLAARLPDYMVPHHYVVMPELPLLPTGKVSRRALPNPFVNGAATAAAGGRGDAIEREIVQFFAETLELAEADRTTDFVRNGGDSLMAAVLAERIHRRYAVTPNFPGLMGSLTPVTLAAAVRTSLAERRAGVAPGSDAAAGGRSQPLAPDLSRLQAVPMSGPSPAWRLAPEAGPGTGAEARVQNLVIIGAGQCGREVFTWAAQAIAAGAKWRIKGFLDSRTQVLAGYDYDAKILGAPHAYAVAEDDVFIGAFGDPRDKKQYFAPIIAQHGRFINIIHPLANVGMNVRMGTGVVLGPFASVTSDARIGDHVSVGAFSNVAHDVIVGDWSQISSHCGLNGRVELGEGVFLGSHACVIPGIKVGSWAYLGAGSVVVKAVDAETKVFGNPAKVIGKVTAG